MVEEVDSLGIVVMLLLECMQMRLFSQPVLVLKPKNVKVLKNSIFLGGLWLYDFLLLY